MCAGKTEKIGLKKIRKRIDLEKRKSEKGAAMIMVLMISFLLLAASAGLILEVSSHTTNVTDAVAEQQAYNAAESGIQSALNVLRGNTTPSPLLDASKSAGDPANKINFRRAVNLSTSNKPGETGTDARLSRWMTYDSTYADRIVLGTGTGAAYTPANGFAYHVTITDPDKTGTHISYRTSGKIDGGGSSKTFGSAGNTATISYYSITKDNLDVSSGSGAADLGRFVVTTTGTGAAISSEVRFEITVTMTKPYTANRVLRGDIKIGTISASSVGTASVDFDSKTYDLMGSTITLADDPLILNPPSTNAGEKTINATMTQAEPIRLLVRSIGFGPRGARKELETVVRKNFFDGLTAPATLTLVGSSGDFVFKSGSSQNVTYSGDDAVSTFMIPPIGTTNQSNLDKIYEDLNGSGRKTDIIGHPANVSTEMPVWLQTAEKLDTTLQALKNVAVSSGRFYASGQMPSNYGNNANATGITFCEGDVSLSGSGGGILIVTGNLTLKGGFDFNGLIIVTGSGGLARSGGGNGSLQGNVVIAPYDPNNLTAGFKSPKYDISGGGTSDITYNSSSLANGLTAVSNFVLGVAEK